MHNPMRTQHQVPGSRASGASSQRQEAGPTTPNRHRSVSPICRMARAASSEFIVPRHFRRIDTSRRIAFQPVLAVIQHQHECVMHSLLIVLVLHSRNRCRASHERQQPLSNQSSRRQTASDPRDRCASQTGSESGENIAVHRRVAPTRV